MATLCYIQSSTVNAYTPNEILAPLENKANAITTYQGDQARVAALFREAQARGMRAYLWVSPRYIWAGMAPEYNLRNAISGYTYDAVAFQLPSARQARLDHDIPIIQAYIEAGVLDGVQLDYIRYEWDDVADYDELNSSDVTAMVQLYRDWCNVQGLKLVASVFWGLTSGGHGGYQAIYLHMGQDWPPWITNDLLDMAYIMSYGLHRYPAAAAWANQPTSAASLARQQVILDPAGTDKVAAPTRAQYDESVAAVEAWGYADNPSLFDWRSIANAGRWSWIEELPEPPEPPPPVTGFVDARVLEDRGDIVLLELRSAAGQVVQMTARKSWDANRVIQEIQAQPFPAVPDTALQKRYIVSETVGNDPLPGFGDMTPDEAVTWIDANVTDLASAIDALKRLCYLR